MLSSDEIKRMSRNELSDPERLLAIKQTILTIEDTDSRNFLAYDLVERLLGEQFWEQAEVFTRLMETWPLEKSWFLGDIASLMWQAGKIEGANALFTEAIQLDRDNGRAWQQGEGMLRIAGHYTQIGERDRAISLLLEASAIVHEGEKDSLAVNNPQDAIDSSGVLREIAETVATLGEIDKAMKIAGMIINNSRRNSAISKIQELSSERRNAG
jgi:tetratricopeptide (TPR) repeat protein